METQRRSSSNENPAFLEIDSSTVLPSMHSEIVTLVPKKRLSQNVRVRISSDSEGMYSFHVAPAGGLNAERLLATYSTALLDGDGAGTGGLLRVYATTNGGTGSFDGYVSNWRSTPVAQKVDYNRIFQHNLLVFSVHILEQNQSTKGSHKVDARRTD
jgi:hypothetical protein